ncbi:hypothetical protein LTR97_003114 [Elasticomyces elasticus]|uniref:Uncharacterized protein n=1 Tax=Elasticomyces elasticus TaxID=574655 RepID=A0AAN7VUG0_9PEZI|nr:hypothetical protein LTR97_003114 [Elasticomyces elasticus]
MDDEDALPPLPQLTMSRSAPLRTLQAPPLIEIDGEEPVLSTSVPIEHTLLGLPPEMRNAIYRYVLVNPDPLEVSPGRPYAYKPAFLSTCRQIRAEADGIFMNENTFTTDPGFHGYGITIPYWHWLNKNGGPMMKGNWEALPWSETEPLLRVQPDCEIAFTEASSSDNQCSEQHNQFYTVDVLEQYDGMARQLEGGRQVLGLARIGEATFG